jgi:Uma2 family endonuclease
MTMDFEPTALLTRNPWVPRRLITTLEYHRMGEAGILDEAERVELIQGQVVVMAAIGSPHAGTVNTLNRLLVTAIGANGVVSVQNPVWLDKYSEPQPDLTVLKPRPDDYKGWTPRPKDVLLLIEVAHTSLKYDCLVKLPLYALAGIAEVWIVNVEAGEVEVWRNPVGESYADCSRVSGEGLLVPEGLPGVVIPVSALFQR